MSEITLLSSLEASQAPRVEESIDRLLPHLDRERRVFVGGIAIRYHLAAAGLSYPTTRLGDLDVSAAVRPSVARNYWIGHSHSDGYLGLVDRRTLFKTDAFKYSTRGLEIVTAPYKEDGSVLPIPSVASQLAKTVTDTRKVIRGVAVSPRQFSDADLLFSLSPDLGLASEMLEAWEPGVTDIEAAYAEAVQAAAEHPEFVASSPHPRPLSCGECLDGTDYPLTPLPLVYGAVALGLARGRLDQLRHHFGVL